MDVLLHKKLRKVKIKTSKGKKSFNNADVDADVNADADAKINKQPLKYLLFS